MSGKYSPTRKPAPDAPANHFAPLKDMGSFPFRQNLTVKLLPGMRNLPPFFLPLPGWSILRTRCSNPWRGIHQIRSPTPTPLSSRRIMAHDILNGFRTPSGVPEGRAAARGAAETGISGVVAPRRVNGCADRRQRCVRQVFTTFCTISAECHWAALGMRTG